ISLKVYEEGYWLARWFRRATGLSYRPVTDLVRQLKELDIMIDAEIPTALFRSAVCAPSRGEGVILRSANDPRMESFVGARFAIVAALGCLFFSAAAQTKKEPPICAAHEEYCRLSETRLANGFAAEFLLSRAVI